MARDPRYYYRDTASVRAGRVVGYAIAAVLGLTTLAALIVAGAWVVTSLARHLF